MNEISKSNPQKAFTPFGFVDDFTIEYHYYMISDDIFKGFHRHNTLEIGYCIKGTGELVFEGKKFPFFAGDIYVINDSEYHAVVNRKGTISEWHFLELNPEKLLVNFNGFDFSLTDTENWSGPRFKNIINTKSGNINGTMHAIVAEMRGKATGYKFITRCLAACLLYQIARTIGADEKDKGNETQVKLQTLNPAIKYMESHFHERMNIAALAKSCGISESQFDRIFRKWMRSSPSGYINRLRIEMSKQLLSTTTMPITDIANETGYGTLWSFNRTFKKQTQIAPRTWRKKFHLKRPGIRITPGSMPKVSIYLTHLEASEEVKIHLKIKDAFEKENPDIKIILEQTPGGGYGDRLRSLTAGGGFSDVLFLETENVFDFCRKGILAPLDNLVAEESHLSKYGYYDKILEMCSFEGQLFLLPRDIAPFVCVYYNKTIFAKNSVSFPRDNWTVQDFLDCAMNFVKSGAKQKNHQFGFASFFWINFIYSFGGRWVDNPFHPRKFLFTSLPALKAFQFIHDMICKYRISPNPDTLNAFNLSTMFTEGKLAMIGSGMWETPVLLNSAKFDWDMAPFPDYQKGISGSGSGYCICKSTKYQAQAWRVVKYFAGIKGQNLLAESGLALPALKEIANSNTFLKSTPKPTNKAFLEKAVKSVIPDPRFEGFNEFRQTVVYPNVERYMEDKITLAKLKTDIDTVVKKKFPWLQIPGEPEEIS